MRVANEIAPYRGYVAQVRLLAHQAESQAQCLAFLELVDVWTAKAR